jgi:hypothetical protein
LRFVSIIGVLAVGLASADASLAASLSVSSARVQEAGDPARVCVSLSSGGEDVVATQNDLIWDPNCASFVDKCEPNAAHGKQLMPNDLRPGQKRVIIISLQDTNTIPDGELYCCTFRVNPESGGSCCAIGLQQSGGSDADGKAIGLTGRGGQVCVASGPGSSGGLQDAPAQRPDVVGTDLGTGAPQPAAQQPAAQTGGSNAAGTGNAVASGGTGGVQGGVGGVPGGVGGVPGGQPGAPPQPGQPQPAAPGSAPAPGEPGVAGAPGVPAARPQAPAQGAPQDAIAAAAGTPTQAPAAAAAPRTQAPAAPAAAPPAARSPVAAAAKTVAKPVAAAPAPTASSSGCNCEIAASGVGYEGSLALVAVGLLLWARRRRL